MVRAEMDRFAEVRGPSGGRRGRWVAAVLAATAIVGAGSPARAEPPGGPKSMRISLGEAVAMALERHPRLAAARAGVDAASAGVSAARAAELPEGGVSAQLNRSTGNSVPGMFFPTPGFSSISGSPRGRALDAGVWQSGVSVWASWNATGFAQKSALVDAALAEKAGARAALSARRLDVAFQVADAFLSALAAEQERRAARASLDRARTLATVVRALVDQNLRPGADAARVEAEVALASTFVARAEQAAAIRRAELAEAIGADAGSVDLVAGELLSPVDDPGPRAAASSPLTHPVVVERQAAVDRAAHVARAVSLEYLPRVDLVAALWARGSGYYDQGLVSGPASGLLPDTPNWAAGVVVTWPIFNIPLIRARGQAARAASAAAIARRDEALVAVAGQVASAAALLEGARRVARNTPAALVAARAAEEQAIARYKAQLASIMEVADAERVLAQAELDDAIARLSVRRARLVVARASGDLSPVVPGARLGGE